MSVDMNDVSYVSRSDYRLQVLALLGEAEAATPSAIAASTDIEITHVSRSLGDLREEGYVELLVDEGTSKGRYHGATERGRETLERLKDLGEVPA